MKNVASKFLTIAFMSIQCYLETNKNKQVLSKMIKQNIAKILDAEMDRKDFLKLMGLGAVAAVGVSSFVKAVTPNLQNQGSRTATTRSATALGYGSMPYGGNVRDTR